MTSRPTDAGLPDYPVWATDALDSEGNPNRVDPGATIKARGWMHGERPPKEWMNWLNYLSSQWVQHFDTMRVQASDRAVLVNPDYGTTAALGADGKGVPFSTIQEAVDYIVTQRGGGATGKAGTRGEWWTIVLVPGVYAEDVDLYGNIHVLGHGARLRGADVAGRPVLRVYGSEDATDPMPVTVEGLHLARTLAEHTTVSRAADLLLEVHEGVGTFAGILPAMSGVVNITSIGAGLLRDCYLQIADFGLAIGKLFGGTDPCARFAGVEVRGYLSLQRCIIDGVNPSIAPLSEATSAEWLVDGGGMQVLDTNVRTFFGAPMVCRIRRPGVRSPGFLEPARIGTFGVGGFGVVRVELDDDWLTDRYGSTSDTLREAQFEFGGTELLAVQVVNTSSLSAANCRIHIVRQGAGLNILNDGLAEIVVDKATLVFQGAVTSAISIADLTSGNLLNGGTVDYTNSDLDEAALDTIASALGNDNLRADLVYLGEVNLGLSFMEYTYPWIGNAAQSGVWFDVCWSPQLGLFVAVGNSAGSNQVMTSPDGITWTARTPSEVNDWHAISWSAELGLFVAVAGSGTNRVMTSPDGITWTARSAAEANGWEGVCWSPSLGLFVAVSEDGTNRVMTSPDGITWTARSAPASTWQGVCWSPQLGLFVAVANSGTNRVMTSPDGITWTARSAAEANGWFDVCWSPQLGLFVAVAGSGTNRVMTSPDGITWTARSAPAKGWFDVCWSPQMSLFIAVTPTATDSEQVMTSPDGITWTARESAETNGWQGVCWSPQLGLFVAVASSGTNHVMYAGTGTP